MFHKGRPVGWRKRLGETKEDFITIMVSEDFKAIVDSERQLRRGERICDTVDRIWKERGLKIILLEKRIIEIEELLKRYENGEPIERIF